MYKVKNFLKRQTGMGTVEIVIIIAVLVGLALIFRNQIYSFVNQIFQRIFNDAGNVISTPSGSEMQNNVLGQ